MEEQLILSIELVDYTRSHASLYIEDIYNVIESLLKLNPSKDVGVIQKGVGHAPKSYKVGIKSREVWADHRLDQFLGEKFQTGTGKCVLIQKAFQRYEDVIVKNVPPIGVESM